jgi:hypothetical protein
MNSIPTQGPDDSRETPFSHLDTPPALSGEGTADDPFVLDPRGCQHTAPTDPQQPDPEEEQR